MRSGKRQITEGTEVPNQEGIRTHGKKENYIYLGILEADTIKQVEMKKTRKEYLRQTRKFLEPKLSSRRPEICCHLDSSERPSAYVGVKNSQEVNNNDTLNIRLHTFSAGGCRQWFFAWFLGEFRVFQHHTPLNQQTLPEMISLIHHPVHAT